MIGAQVPYTGIVGEEEEEKIGEGAEFCYLSPALAVREGCWYKAAGTRAAPSHTHSTRLESVSAPFPPAHHHHDPRRPGSFLPDVTYSACNR